MRRPLTWRSLGMCITKDIRQNIAEVFEPMYIYKILNFKNTVWCIIHIKHQNTDKNICD
jgi:hypothetical protein